jgi:hypothetical protein
MGWIWQPIVSSYHFYRAHDLCWFMGCRGCLSLEAHLIVSNRVRVESHYAVQVYPGPHRRQSSNRGSPHLPLAPLSHLAWSRPNGKRCGYICCIKVFSFDSAIYAASGLWMVMQRIFKSTRKVELQARQARQARKHLLPHGQPTKPGVTTSTLHIVNK